MSMTSQSGLTGLQQLRELAGRRIEIGETLGFRLADVEEGRAVFESKPGRHLYSPIGTVHGGYAATLLDFGLRMRRPFPAWAHSRLHHP